MPLNVKNDEMEKSNTTLLKEARDKRAQGDLNSAKQILNSLLGSREDGSVSFELALIAIQQSEFDYAAELFNRAISKNPTNLDYWTGLISSLIKSQKIEEAKGNLLKVKASKTLNKDLLFLEQRLFSVGKSRTTQSESEKAQSSKIIEFINKGELNEGLRLAIELRSQFPKSINAINLLGSIYQRLGKPKLAISEYKSGLKMYPSQVDLLNNLGIVYRSANLQTLALQTFKKLKQLHPQHLNGLHNFALVLMDMQDYKAATVLLKEALDFSPNNARLLNDLGVCEFEIGNVDEAFKSYKKAIEIENSFLDPYVNVCELLEKSGTLIELEQWLEICTSQFKDLVGDILLYKVIMMIRRSNLEEAQKELKNIKVNEISFLRQALYYQTKGKLEEYQKDYSSAFKSFEKMNAIGINSAPYELCSPEVFLNNIKYKLNNRYFESCVTAHDYQSPVQVFLIGFPRSGTTLTDTILSSHSHIQVVEEKPALQKAHEFLITRLRNKKNVQKIDQELIEKARNVYWFELDNYLEKYDKNSVIVDKLPLNLLDIETANILFPKAKFILILRHPLDAIMSNWKQNFVLNDAMSNMLRLNTTVELYTLAMELLEHSRETFNLDLLEVRYEDIVTSFDAQVSRILQFLGLPWEEKIKNYYETAKSKTISTPSYSQVVKPLYTSSCYHWKNYEHKLAEYIPTVQKWIDRYGYQID